MQVSMKSVLAGGFAVAAAAIVSPAFAGDGQVHVLSVQLPSGEVEQIQYTGDVAPQVVLLPAQSAPSAAVFAADPFATLERISAMMDRQAATMLRQMQAMTAAPFDATPALPPGASGYSFVSTMSGNGVCTRSVRITYDGADAAPKMVSSTSGDCGHDTQAPTQINTPPGRPSPNTIEAKATQARVSQANAPHEVAWNR